MTFHVPLDFWDQRFAEDVYAYGTAPNRFFEAQLAHLTPAHILLPAEGQGRNAVHAARQGWQVTAFDTSQVGQGRALALAQQYGVQLDYHLADFAAPPFAPATFDALGLIFVHTLPELRPQIHRQLSVLLKPGGVLILEGFSQAQFGRPSGGPQDQNKMFTCPMLQEDFGHMEILLLEEVDEVLDEGPYHQGAAARIRLVARQH